MLATAPLSSTAERVQDLLADLAEFATALEQGLGARLRKESCHPGSVGSHACPLR